MKIQYLGHSCLYIQTIEKFVLVDPFITANELANHIDINDLKVDYMIVTHAHQDHILDVELVAKNNPEVVLISNWEIATYYGNKGIKNHPMNTGGKWNFDFGTLYCTLAHHSSSFPDGSYGGNANGYVLKTKEKTLYIAGDTCLFNDMKLIPDNCGKIDASVLPIGDNFTMDYQQAIVASDFLQCNNVIAYHYDTFGFIKINHEKVVKSFTEIGKDIHLLPIGEAIIL